MYWIKYVFLFLSFIPVYHICLPSDNTCVSGSEIKSRSTPRDSDGWTFIAPNKVIACDGEISEWRYQGTASHAFRAVVWRQVPGSTTQFQIVGINDISASSINIPVTYTVPADKRIRVTAGDMIGWSFGSSVITFDYNTGSNVRWIGGFLHASLQPGQIHTFNGIGQDGPRDYSIQAVVETVLLPEEGKTAYKSSITIYIGPYSLNS